MKKICIVCREFKEHRAKGICESCYCKQYKRQHTYPIIECKKCSELKEHHALGMCSACWHKEYYKSNRGKLTIKKYRQSDARKRSVKKYKQSERGKKANKKYRQSEKGKEARRRHHKRHRGLGTTEIFIIPLHVWQYVDIPKTVDHHLCDLFLTTIPKTIHLANYGNNHRQLINDWFSKIGIDINKIER